MNTKCKSCGAPIEIYETSCPYCGTVTPYGEEALIERKKQEHEAERKKKFSDMPRFKYVSAAFLPVIYFFTAAFYSPYWYLTRINALNLLVPEYKKLPRWAVVIYAALWACVIFLPSLEENLDITINYEQEQNIINISLWLAIILSIYLAYIARSILQEYAAKFLGENAAVYTIASSNILLILFGAAYIQTQINKLISMEFISPQKRG